MGMAFEQFLSCLRNPIARRRIGLDLTDAEAERVLNDDNLARAYFANWSQKDRARAAPAGPPPQSTPTIVSATPMPPVGRPKKKPSVARDLFVASLLVVVGIAVAGGITSAVKDSTGESASSGSESRAVPAPAREVVDPAAAAATARDRAAKADGWQVVESGETYMKAAEKGTYTCSYGRCIWYHIHSISGCSNGFYIQADLMRDGVAVDWTNATSASVRPDETVAVEVADYRSIAEKIRLSEIRCM